MNTIARSLIIVMALCLTAGGVRATEPSATVLTDNQMAAAKGGFCPFEECESAPGTGICQTYPPEELCNVTICRYSNESAGGVDIFSCGFVGEYTCSELTTYRQCILAFKMSFCSNGPDALHCGVIIEPECHIVNPDRQCICAVYATADPCDWTDCVDGL